MSFFAYIYQLKISLKRFFYSNKNFSPEQEQSQCAKEVNENCINNLELKCKKAALEIKYLQNFTYWPISEAKHKIKQNAIVYLDINHNKQKITKLLNNNKNKEALVNDKKSLSHEIRLAKKFP